MTDNLIPETMPTTLGRGDRNGDRCRWQSVASLEQGCQHLGLKRRRRQPGFCGEARLTASTLNNTFRFRLEREPYTNQMVCVVVYSTSSPNVSADLVVGSPVDPAVVTLPGTSGPGADAAEVVRVPVLAGDIEPADATREDFTATVSSVTSSDPIDLTPTVIIWSVKWRTDRLSTANIQP